MCLRRLLQPLRLAGRLRTRAGASWAVRPQDSRGPKAQLWASAAFPSPVPPPTPWLAAVLWRTEGESGVTGECAKYRDTAHKEAQGYSLYGVNAPACKPGPDGKPAEEQPDWPSECAGRKAGCCAGDAAAQLRGCHVGWPGCLPPADHNPCMLTGPPLCVCPNMRLPPPPCAGPPNPLFDPCASARVGAWFNRQDVQEAIHAIQVCGGASCVCSRLPASYAADACHVCSASLLVHAPLRSPEENPAHHWAQLSLRAPTTKLKPVLFADVPPMLMSCYAAGRGGTQVEGVRCTGPHVLT